MSHRRVAIQLFVKGTNVMQVVLATNLSKDHNIYFPQLLPMISGVISEKAQVSKEELYHSYIYKGVTRS